MMQDSLIKQKYVNINRNNINGAFFIGDTGIFYKILTKEEYKQEIEAYDLIKKYYRVPQRYFNIANNNKYIVGYEYINNIDVNKGLLVDYFSNNDILTDKYYEIINIYASVFNNTICLGNYTNCKILFDNRLDNRFKANYNNKFLNSLNGKQIKINSQKCIINLDNIISNVKKYFEVKTPTFLVVSQCDPNDLNVCEDGMILDYTPGGYVPLMAEVATFFWYYLAQGEYLAVKYNKKAFNNHSNIKKRINKVTFSDDKVIHNFREIRRDAIILYMKKVTKPALEKVDFKDWYNEFKVFLAMKVMAVFDFDTMEEKDIILSIGYLQLFFDKNFENIDDFINYIEEL